MTRGSHFLSGMGRFGCGVIATGLFMAVMTMPAGAGMVEVPGMFGGPARVEVTSLKEARFQTVIKQQFDFSCGSAAVASLLTYHYDHPIDEITVFNEMFENGDQERIQSVGFSLLDMKRFLEDRGYSADGFETDLDRLADVGVPAIALINTGGYKHFVLIKGIQGPEVVVGDPALGVRVLDRDAFEEMWNGVIFVVRNKASVGREHFNQAADWNVRVRAPFGTALSQRSLSNFTVHLTGPIDSF